MQGKLKFMIVKILRRPRCLLRVRSLSGLENLWHRHHNIKEYDVAVHATNPQR